MVKSICRLLQQRNNSLTLQSHLELLYIYSMNYTNNTTCEHIQQVDPNINAKTPNGCEECLQMGSEWVQLRLCLSCGHVGCCDSSPNKHATKHFHQTTHPVIKFYQSDED